MDNGTVEAHGPSKNGQFLPLAFLLSVVRSGWERCSSYHSARQASGHAEHRAVQHTPSLHGPPTPRWHYLVVTYDVQRALHDDRSPGEGPCVAVRRSAGSVLKIDVLQSSFTHAHDSPAEGTFSRKEAHLSLHNYESKASGQLQL